jgi:endogenous inhibitor of DNA gyrase (YacG/DUF329 family)
MTNEELIPILETMLQDTYNGKSMIDGRPCIICSKQAKSFYWADLYRGAGNFTLSEVIHSNPTRMFCSFECMAVDVNTRIEQLVEYFTL